MAKAGAKPPEASILGGRVKQAIEQSGKSLRELAKLVGVRESELSRIQTGQKTRTDFHTIDKLAAVLDYPWEFFAIAARADTAERKAHPRIHGAVQFARENGIPEWAIDEVANAPWPEDWTAVDFFHAMELAMRSGRESSHVRPSAPRTLSSKPPKAAGTKPRRP